MGEQTHKVSLHAGEPYSPFPSTPGCAENLIYKTLARKTTREDWERCTFYAHRVRRFGSIELDTSSPGEIKGSIPTDKTVYMALKRSYENDNEESPPFLRLPKLRSCRLVPHTSAPAPHWNTFLTHTLRSLELRFPEYDPEETLPRVLHSIGKESPFLQHLRIDGVCPTSSFEPVGGDGGSEGRSSLGDPFTRMLLDLHDLETLVCPQIQFPDEGVRYLARKMNVGVLHIKNTAMEILEALDYGGREETCFGYLRRLNVECSPGGGLEECTRLLERVANVSRIEGLEVGRQGRAPTESELRNFIHKLSNLITSSSISTISAIYQRSTPSRASAALKSLHIHQGANCDFFPPPYPSRLPLSHATTLETLSPLLAFPSLEVLNIALDTPFSIGDRDAERMSKAWPKLELLRLGFPGSGWGVGLSVTTDGLESFARHCKELRVLGVCMSLDPKGGGMDGNTEDDAFEEKLVRGCSLQILEVGDSVFYDEPEHVAECLFKIFPGLHSVFGPDVIISPFWQKKWARVSLKVRELSLQRSTCTVVSIFRS